MAVILTQNPVVTEGGITKNLFAGFDKVEYKFQRKDLEGISVGQGIDNQVLINVSEDLRSYLSVGDTVYLFAEGDTFTYDDTGDVIAITAATVTISIDFIEVVDDGYINYFKNYFLEVELVNKDNSDIKVLPFSLRDDGSNSGLITIDVSIANDKNIQFFEFATQELTASRILFKVQYREVYDIVIGSYTLLNDVIILVYATEQPEIEQFINELEEPKLWKGYPYGVVLTHSDDNTEEQGINVSYDELDINQLAIVVDVALGSFISEKQGFLFNDIDKDIAYDADTEYIKLKGVYGSQPQYNPAQYNNTQYKVS